MKKRLTSLLLALVFCCVLCPSALAAGSITATGEKESSKVTVTATGLSPGYYMGAIWKGGELLVLFDGNVSGDGKLADVETGYVLQPGDELTVSVADSSGYTYRYDLIIPNDTEDPGNTPGGDPGAATTYRIYLFYDSHGSVSSYPSLRAAEGDTVTLYVYPDSNYELGSLRVTDAAGARISYYSLGGDRYRFTMPASYVNVDATFDYIGRSSSSGTYIPPITITPGTQTVPQAGVYGQIFLDIPMNHWAAGEIAWAQQIGYMNGTGGGNFSPDRAITHQQLWTVLARLLGGSTASMSKASLEAVRNGLVDSGSPASPVTRQQLMTAFYRCAFLKRASITYVDTLRNYPDSGQIVSSSHNAMAWAVSSGILSGTSGGRLNPNGSVTRAQFAVFLYRFHQRT